ncbi:MAG: hypothetical protein Q8R02_13025 [Hyphomonadaceae bacterium]|nr:hypothetical protein [Hyphomonadaceae bacterium]
MGRPVIGGKQDRRGGPLAAETRGAVQGEVFRILRAGDEARHAQEEPVKAGGGVDAGVAAKAGPLDGHRHAEKLARLEADDDVEDMLGVGDHGFRFGAGVWVVRQPLKACLVVDHAHGHPQEVAEAVGVPEHWRKPAKEPKDDFGHGHGAIIRQRGTQQDKLHDFFGRVLAESGASGCGA